MAHPRRAPPRRRRKSPAKRRARKPARRSRRTSRKRRASSRRRAPALTRAAIGRALMPAMVTQEVTTAQVTSGFVRNISGGFTQGAASTGKYGLAQFEFFNYNSLVALRNLYMTSIAPTGLQAMITAATPNANDRSRFYLKSKFKSHLANTSGTTVIVDFLRFKTLRNMVPDASLTARRVAATAPANVVGGSPLNISQMLFNSNGPADQSVGGYTEQLDQDFWRQAEFGRYYKLVGKSSVSLTHGQSVEFAWGLPTVSFSMEELNQIAGNGTGNEYIGGKTYFTVWRIRGALGAILENANTTASTSIATAVVATTREYHLKMVPIQGDVRQRFITAEWPQSATQVWVNNEYGTGLVLQPDNTM